MNNSQFSGDRKFVCELCGKSYFAACELSRHRRNKHNTNIGKNQLVAHKSIGRIETDGNQEDNGSRLSVIPPNDGYRKNTHHAQDLPLFTSDTCTTGQFFSG